jgi:hypothetical protein
MTETREKGQTVEEEIGALDEQIREMEAKFQEEEQPLIWGEGYAEELEAREKRRVILPRLITATKVKRAELRIQRERQAAEPLQAQQEAAYNKMQRAEARKLKADEDLMAARSEWSGVHTRLEKIGRRIRNAEREIEALQEGRSGQRGQRGTQSEV